jgi:hypothetical protein
MGCVVTVDHREEGAEVTDVGVVSEQESGHVAEPEARLVLGGGVVTDVVVGHSPLRGDDTETVLVVWRVRGCRWLGTEDRGESSGCQNDC